MDDGCGVVFDCPIIYWFDIIRNIGFARHQNPAVVQWGFDLVVKT